jgi:hypothetical protein
MAHAKARVAALFQVRWRASKTIDQKAAKTIFGTRQIVSWVHGAEDVVSRDLTIEGRDKTVETIVADRGVNLCVLHQGEV